MQRAAVVLFARSPEREAAAKGMPNGAPLFRRVIRAWLEAASRAGVAALVACEEEDRAALASVAPSIARTWLPQRGGTFGARVANAAEDALASFDAVVLAAIDAPPPASLAYVLDAVAAGATVIGAARDGGVNFIAASFIDRTLLEDLSVANCRARVSRLVVLAATTDADSRVAVQQAARERAWRGLLSIPTHCHPSDAPVPCATFVRPSSPRAPPSSRAVVTP